MIFIPFNKKKMLIQNRHRFTTAYLESNYLQGNKKNVDVLERQFVLEIENFTFFEFNEKQIYRKYYNNMIRRNVFD